MWPGIACCLFCSAVVAVPAMGRPGGYASSVSSEGWRLSVGAAGGTVIFDDHLADYRWDTRPVPQWGTELMLGRGRYAAGVRLWRAQTTQASGVPGATDALRVNLTALELVGQIRLLQYRGFELRAQAHGGKLHIGYDPDRLTIAGGVAAESIAVDFAPIDEWEYGAGLGTSRAVTRRAAVSVFVEASHFRLDTAHRRGNEIVELREGFLTWSLRLQLAWLVSL